MMRASALTPSAPGGLMAASPAGSPLRVGCPRPANHLPRPATLSAVCPARGCLPTSPALLLPKDADARPDLCTCRQAPAEKEGGRCERGQCRRHPAGRCRVLRACPPLHPPADNRPRQPNHATFTLPSLPRAGLPTWWPCAVHPGPPPAPRLPAAAPAAAAAAAAAPPSLTSAAPAPLCLQGYEASETFSPAASIATADDYMWEGNGSDEGGVGAGQCHCC